MNDDFNPTMNDRELAAVASELDVLARADGVRPGLEDRIFTATQPLLGQPSRHQPRLRLAGGRARAPIARARFMRNLPVRLAAAVALAATIGLTWMATRQAPIGPSGGVTIASTPSEEEWAIMSAAFDDGMNDEIDAINSATSALRSSIDSFSLSDMLEEGAM